MMIEWFYDLVSIDQKIMESNQKVTKKKEVRENAKIFFQNLEKGVYDEYLGKYALMRHKEVIQYFDTRDDARRAGNMMYEDRLFSIQKVEKQNIDLGYFSHANF